MTTLQEPSRVRAVCLRKDFGGADILHDANLMLRAGELHALVGENRAGKSILAKLIGGGTCRGPGTWNRAVDPRRCPTRVAMAQGIALIHQEPLFFPT